MKYTMVKQFLNSAIDNIFNFGFKVWDFLKILLEAFLMFLEIWVAFFLIFYNFFMYIYYLILFIIDRGAESSEPVFFMRRKLSGKASYIPSVEITSSHNPVPAMYRSSSRTASLTAPTASRTENISSHRASGYKKPFFRSIFESSAGALTGLLNAIKKAFILLGKKLKPVREYPEDKTERKSLIDEYMKEYEKKNK